MRKHESIRSLGLSHFLHHIHAVMIIFAPLLRWGSWDPPQGMGTKQATTHQSGKSHVSDGTDKFHGTSVMNVTIFYCELFGLGLIIVH